jgi:hypothetical protein
MNRTIFALVAASLLTLTASAQQVDSAELRAAMVDHASALYETVAGGRDGVETMVGVNRGRSLVLALDDPARETWQYWPTERVGLELGLMTAAQRDLTHKLLNSILSSQGYLKAVQIMQLEQILAILDQVGLPRSVGHYKLVLFGRPDAAADWAWRFEGHHISLSVSVAPDGISVTPSFFGSNPARISSGPLTGVRVLGGVEDLARELVDSLNARERAMAVVSDRAPAEIFTTILRKERDQWLAWRDTLQPEGIDVRDLNEVQQHWVRRLLAEVIANYREEVASQYLDSIELEDLSFAWMGSTAVGEPHYFRLQGGDFLYEYDNVQNGGNHVHSVWHSQTTDFGMGVLASHYQASAH